MAKTSLNSLNEYLFEALDRITNEDLTDEQLDQEISRANATVDIARTIIENGNLTLKVMQHMDEYGKEYRTPVSLLEDK